MRFAKHYGAGPKRLTEVFGLVREQVGETIKAFHEAGKTFEQFRAAFPELARYAKEQTEKWEAKEKRAAKKVCDAFGVPPAVVGGNKRPISAGGVEGIRSKLREVERGASESGYVRKVGAYNKTAKREPERGDMRHDFDGSSFSPSDHKHGADVDYSKSPSWDGLDFAPSVQHVTCKHCGVSRLNTQEKCACIESAWAACFNPAVQTHVEFDDQHDATRLIARLGKGLVCSSVSNHLLMQERENLPRVMDYAAREVKARMAEALLDPPRPKKEEKDGKEVDDRGSRL